jgi:hypothetical protein
MKCDKVVEKYLKLEDYSAVPLILKIHILLCRECRKEISGLKKVFSLMINDSPYKSATDISTSVMNIIRAQHVSAEKTISGIKWVSIGTIIFSSILLVNYSESFIWLKVEFGSDYTIPMNIVMGFILTAYSAILIACNYEYIKKYIDLHSKWKFKW